MNTDLRSRLAYEPKELRFGTSGRRGEVAALTQLEITITATAELRYLLSLPPGSGGIKKGDPFYFAYDLRPSSCRFVPEQNGNGELAQAIEAAIANAGLLPVNMGRIPTPAVTAYAIGKGHGSIMVTGSHIPFDRNGYKCNTSIGELRKTDEAPIQRFVEAVRQELYSEAFDASPFDEHGRFKTGSRELSPESDEARYAYRNRYVHFFSGEALSGSRVLVYQHSAVGRDMLVELLQTLGADVVAAGRSDTFVPIDTENIGDAELETIQSLLSEATQAHGRFDAVVSTDGDSDRPLILGVSEGAVRFFGGDLVGMVVAQYLDAGAVVVPISCNDAIDRGELQNKLEPRTKIGSPYVIAGMNAARKAGKENICGWEANGGFLTGSNIVKNGNRLPALPTRDAFLPLLATLFAAQSQNMSLGELFDALPKRFSKAALLRPFPRETSDRIIAQLTPSASARSTDAIRADLEGVFTPAQGFGNVQKVDYTDGVRVYFDNNDVAHLRPSGNAPELRIYAVADTQERADAIVSYGVAEPNGALRQFEAEAHNKLPALICVSGTVQHYDWGGYTFLPDLLRTPNKHHEPFAELWLGAHPNAPATATVNGESRKLDALFAAHGEELLGAAGARFGNALPYLLKVLDARKMLSIQAHPTIAQAKAGYEREDAAKIALSAPNRNYRDRNHKPEVHVALTPFYLLHGFRPLEEISAEMKRTPELSALMTGFAARLEDAGSDKTARGNLLRALYKRAMTLPQAGVDAILNALLSRLQTRAESPKSSPDYWARRAATEFPLPDDHRDRGIFSIYLLNLVHLSPGQGTYQPAGVLHAYLEGANMELMAASDNVLRGGLTPKHVDVNELLAVVDFSDGTPEVLFGEAMSPVETVYKTPASEFEIRRIALPASETHGLQAIGGADTLFVYEGAVKVVSIGETQTVRRGGAILIRAGRNYNVTPIGGAATMFRAVVPPSENTD